MNDPLPIVNQKSKIKNQKCPQTFKTEIFFIRDDGQIKQCGRGLLDTVPDIDHLRSIYRRYHLRNLEECPDYPPDILLISRRIG